MSGTDDRDRYDDYEDEEEPPRRRVIDVTEEEPVVVERGQDFPFSGYAPEVVRVYVARGGRRACAIPLALILLTICCGCLGFWVLADNLF